MYKPLNPDSTTTSLSKNSSWDSHHRKSPSGNLKAERNAPFSPAQSPRPPSPSGFGTPMHIPPKSTTTPPHTSEPRLSEPMLNTSLSNRASFDVSDSFVRFEDTASTPDHEQQVHSGNLPGIEDMHQSQQPSALWSSIQVNFTNMSPHQRRGILMIFVCMVVPMITVSILLWVFYKPILNFANGIAKWGQVHPIWAAIITISYLIICCFPPMFGYALTVTMSGFIFGFPLGFLPVFVGAMIGSILCFIFGRRWGSRYVRYIMEINVFLAECVKVVETGGFKLLLFVRMAPYPFNIMNLLLSATNISIYHYIAATAISLVKLLFYVYIGSNVSALADLLMEDSDDGNSSHKKISTLKLVLLLSGGIIAVATMIYIMFLARRRIEKLAKKMHENDEIEMA
ncbi:Tlg2-vesicle protein [Mycoemilia scoparia]|uniref:Golgi apparatus membrane protein TVP38 n=1 Tax=Mycoemilia scoparia TaxID=417184 RepID=A0A9W8A9T7_9FUNG|nr:Tlg2-vesicle protein [Mycoemilia scoparia]